MSTHVQLWRLYVGDMPWGPSRESCRTKAAKEMSDQASKWVNPLGANEPKVVQLLRHTCMMGAQNSTAIRGKTSWSWVGCFVPFEIQGSRFRVFCNFCYLLRNGNGELRPRTCGSILFKNSLPVPLKALHHLLCLSCLDPGVVPVTLSRCATFRCQPQHQCVSYMLCELLASN